MSETIKCTTYSNGEGGDYYLHLTYTIFYSKIIKYKKNDFIKEFERKNYSIVNSPALYTYRILLIDSINNKLENKEMTIFGENSSKPRNAIISNCIYKPDMLYGINKGKK